MLSGLLDKIAAGGWYVFVSAGCKAFCAACRSGKEAIPDLDSRSQRGRKLAVGKKTHNQKAPEDVTD